MERSRLEDVGDSGLDDFCHCRFRLRQLEEIVEIDMDVDQASRFFGISVYSDLRKRFNKFGPQRVECKAGNAKKHTRSGPQIPNSEPCTFSILPVMRTMGLMLIQTFRNLDGARSVRLLLCRVNFL